MREKTLCVDEQVRQKPAKAEDVTADMIAWIRGNYHPTDCGIVYCQTRKVDPPATFQSFFLLNKSQPIRQRHQSICL